MTVSGVDGETWYGRALDVLSGRDRSSRAGKTPVAPATSDPTPVSSRRPVGRTITQASSPAARYQNAMSLDDGPSVAESTTGGVAIDQYA